MEVKINKDIREFTENVYFGLNLRQFIFSVLACIMAIGLYFLLRHRFGIETLSWVCIIGASPFAVIGFVKINGLTAEKFVWHFIKSEILMPNKLLFKPINVYYEQMKPYYNKKKKENITIPKQKKHRKRLRIKFSVS